MFSLKRYPERVLDRWARCYGPIYSVRLGSQLFVVLSDPKVAKDLLATHGALFSDRKQTFIKSQTVFAGGRGITASPYNESWRKHRRIAHSWLNQKAVDSYTYALELEATHMISDLYSNCVTGQSNINPQIYAGRYVFNNMLDITFGFRTTDIQDSLVSVGLRLSREFTNITGPVSNLVDVMPILQYFPSTVRSRGRKLHNDLLDTYGGLIKTMDHRLSAGDEVNNCLVKDMLLKSDRDNLDDLDMALLASAFMIGGVETTAAVIQWFAAVIPAHPDIQRRAQQELDCVVGRGRLPTVKDEAQLPYCRAIIKEVERCYNPAWLGTPHMASDDFVYNGHLIPKGTVVLLNTWTMHHDATRWESPMEFSPDRYINDPRRSSESARLPDPRQRDHWMFGAGRRICPGMLVAEREIWLAISCMLWAFSISHVPGKPIDLGDYDGMSGRSPAAFEISLKPRFDGVGRVLEEYGG